MSALKFGELIFFWCFMVFFGSFLPFPAFHPPGFFRFRAAPGAWTWPSSMRLVRTRAARPPPNGALQGAARRWMDGLVVVFLVGYFRSRFFFYGFLFVIFNGDVFFLLL